MHLVSPILFRLLSAVGALALLSGLNISHAQGVAPPLPGICSESDRFGVAVAGSVWGYDVAQLHAGWYHNFTVQASPLKPNGMWYAQTIRVSKDGPFPDRACDTCPTWTLLDSLVQANPDSLWLIGNEPDRQDYVYPDRYAQIYHDLYTFIKARDPSARIGIGGVVQATPIRLQYLDRILAAYRNRYGSAMPIDVWNIHHYLLREADDWGGGIPPGTDPSLGILYTLDEHDMLEPSANTDDKQMALKVGWKQHLVDFRRWMRDNGYRDRPLIITEFGTLMPDFYGYDYDRVRRFMLATFDWLTTTTDPNLGYPADGNRLVQAWAWYSLNHKDFETWPSWNHLFDPNTYQIMPLGQDFARYTSALTAPLPGSIDLQPTSMWHTDPQPTTGGLVRMDIKVEIRNHGAAAAHNALVRIERDSTYVDELTIPYLGPGASQVVSLEWTGLIPNSLHRVTVTVNPNATIIECDPFNNRLSAPVLVTDIRMFLPIIVRSR